MKGFKEKSVRQAELTSECFLIQIFGISQCNKCEWLETKDCGGKKTRKMILDGLFPFDGLPAYKEKK